MRIAFFSTHPFDRQFFDDANGGRHDVHYLEARLTAATTGFAAGCPAVCAFVNDRLDGTVLTALAGAGTRLIALRTAGVEYVGLRDLWGRSDIITLHAPLTPQTRHLVDASAIALMRPGVMLINTSGELVDTPAVIAGLKSGQVGSLGLDVYEEEEQLFFDDHSSDVIQDDAREAADVPDVLVTAHQAFFTREALGAISRVTLENVSAFEQGRRSGNELS